VVVVFIIGVGVCVIAFVAWELLRLLKKRGSHARRRKRMVRGIARQKAWDIVFGRRTQRRLTVLPPEPGKE
jgi:hypothetical protein